MALKVEAARYVFYSDFVDYDDEWSEDHFEKRLQKDTDLGGRMEAAFREILLKHDKAVIIGSDCIQLTYDIIHTAYNQLDNNDAYIGPSTDGGYYLLGLKKSAPTLFQNIEWSTDTVCQVTQARIMELGSTLHLGPKLTDVDHYEDWVNFKEFI